MTIKVAIVEDDAGVRQGLARVLGRAQDFRCVGAFSDAEAALQQLPDIKPEVVLMDINLPGMSGVECARKLKTLLPATQIMMVTVYEDPERIFEALAAGATGYLLKKTPPAQLLNAIRDVRSGGAPMSSQIARKVVSCFQTAPSSDSEQLSPREQEILKALAQGFLIKEIADQLSIGFDTVRTHIRRIYDKLHVHSRAQAVAKYFPAGAPRQADGTRE
jgi:DNA-binding NarL/FixJ family response regulator